MVTQSSQPAATPAFPTIDNSAQYNVTNNPIPVEVVNTHTQVIVKGSPSFPGMNALKRAISKLGVVMNYMKKGFVGLCCGSVPGGAAGAIGGGVVGALIGTITTGGLGTLPMAIAGATTGAMCVGSFSGGTCAILNMAMLHNQRTREYYEGQQDMNNSQSEV